MWLSIQCRGGAAVLSVPEYVAKISLVQTDYTGVWIPSAGSQNATSGLWLVTGLGIKLNQNVSVANDALATLAYIKDADNVHTSSPAFPLIVKEILLLFIPSDRAFSS